jgi:starch phosphorylase
MWRPLFHDRPEEGVPIGHITNGVHVPTWVAPQMSLLFDRHLGTHWTRDQRLPETWEGIETVDDAELWETQQVLKARLINFVRNRLVSQARRRNESDASIQRLMEALDLNALTIGFARRFATYKRAGLILKDVERLTDMVRAADRPIQIIFAGKAHPEDRHGKELIQGIVRITRQEPFFNKIVFVEDYDMNVARSLVQGVDVWLNNPRRPQEASGTSGQKAALNGSLNFSVLDGWWAEAYDGTNGFAIGNGRAHAVPATQDQLDHDSLLETLTGQVVPLYYRRDATGLPREWIARQKNAFRTLAWRFNADRMVMDYARRSYLPAAGAVSCAMPGE